MDACREIAISGGTLIVDCLDVELVLSWPYSWFVDSQGYCAAHHERKGTVRIHRVLMGFPPFAIDHIDRNRLNNRRSNLRVCTNAQNQANRVALPHSSRFKGVTLQRRTGRYEAQIVSKGRKIHLGTFATEEDAAKAYDAAARNEWGEFARTNF